VDEFAGRSGSGSHGDVWRTCWSEEVLDFTDFLEFTIANLRSEFNKTGFVAFDYEAAAFGQVENFAEPPQTFFVTPAVRMRESQRIFKRRYQSQTFQLQQE
jgi:hypothetical protein